MKTETKEVIADQFHKYLNDSRRSKTAIAKAIRVVPSYLSYLIKCPHKIPSTSILIMQAVMERCGQHDWTLDEYINKSVSGVPVIDLDEEQIKLDSQKAEKEIKEAAADLKEAVGREPVRPDLGWIDEVNPNHNPLDHPMGGPTPPPVLHGWVCPVCGRGNSPYTTTCLCIPHSFSVTC